MESGPTKAVLLLVDDEPELMAVNRQLLSGLGHKVHTVPSGEEAVCFLRDHHADMVILDMVMPGLDGVQTLKAIQEFKPEQKVVVLSAYAEEDKIAEVKALGVYAYMQKPVDLRKMSRTIKDTLAGVRSPEL